LVLEARGVAQRAVEVHVEGEHDVVTGEGGSVAPLHAAARHDGELRVVVVPLDRFGEPRGGAEVAREVDEGERLEDDLGVAVLRCRGVSEERVVRFGGDGAVGLGDRQGGARRRAAVGARRAPGQHHGAESDDRTDGDHGLLKLHCFLLVAGCRDSGSAPGTVIVLPSRARRVSYLPGSKLGAPRLPMRWRIDKTGRIEDDMEKTVADSGSRGTRSRPATALKRTEILKAAIETFGAKGSTNGTLADIAEQVGMTHAGVLHHFGSKQNLLLE